MNHLPERPDRPPSAIVRAAQARLLDRLDVLPVEPSSEALPDPLDGAGECTDEERYEFGELLATGGLGLVRRAFDRRLGRTVAVKELQRSDPAAERRFLFEAAITAHLQHPGIVPIYDTGRFPGGGPYYCMKLVDGESLEQIIGACETAARRLTLLEHVLAAADAVAYAHSRGIIHRDLKPANILVGEHGETLVIDWGLAKDLAGAILEPVGATTTADPACSSTLTDVGAIVGTLRYMPPEQARGEAVDRRSDVFALGAVLFHVIAGRPPHEGLTRAALLARLADGEVEELAPLADGVPRALVAIAQKAMASGPEDRYPGAEAFADDLRRFLAGRLVDAHRYQPGELLRAWLRRHRAVLSVAAVALLALLAASVLFLWNVGVERELAASAQHRAEIAELEAVRRADSAELAQARGALAEDLVAALMLLGQVDLSDEARRRSARLTALAAEARGAPDRVLRGHSRGIEHIAPLSDGKLVSIDIAGEVRRWDPRTGQGEVLFDIAARGGRLVAAAEAPVWVALAADRGVVVRGDEVPEEISLGPFYVGSFRTHDWELSRHGETLAALGAGRTMSGQRRAGAYTWDLLTRPALMRTLPADYTNRAALSPDGTTLATADAQRDAWLIAGDTATAVPGLTAPGKFSPSGRYLLGSSLESPRSMVALSLSDRSLHPVDGRVVAMTLDDHALVTAQDPTGGIAPDLPRRLFLRSLATGETQWTADLEITREVIMTIWGEGGGFAIADRGDRFALQLGDQWQIWSMATGMVESTLDTGPYKRGAFLADGSFVVAHHTDLWLWSPPPPAPPHYSAYALAPDGSHAIGNTRGAGYLALLRMSDRRETLIACMTALRLSPLSRAQARLAVDARGRVLSIDEAGQVCMNEVDGQTRLITVPERATAAALADKGDAFGVGLDDGAVLAWNAAGEEPRRWQLDAEIRQLWMIGEGGALIAQTGSGAVIALRPGDDAPAVLGSSAPDKDPYSVRVVKHPEQSGAAILLDDEDAVVFYEVHGAVVRRPTSFSIEAAAAYSPSGRQFAVGLAGRTLLVLASPDDPGRELALPEEARGLAFIDEHELAILGESGALLRVDLVIGEAVVMHRSWKYTTGPTHASAAVSGRAVFYRNASLFVQPADPVPGDSSGLQAWLLPRIR